MEIAQMPVALNGKARTPDVYAGAISLRGIRSDEVPLLWGWMNEFPRCNFDDYGPQTLEAFDTEIAMRIGRREIICMALHNDNPVGCIGYLPITERVGLLRGICFSREVHGKGVAPFAVQKFIEKAFGNGKLQKLKAVYFKDNLRIKKFLRAQGFVHEGTLVAETMRGGNPMDMSLVALMRPKPQRAN